MPGSLRVGESGGDFVCARVLEQRLDHRGVELRAAVAPQLLLRLLGRQCPAIRAIERHGDVGVGDVDDPRFEGDLVAGEAVRTAGAVDVLVMLGDELGRAVEPQARSSSAPMSWCVCTTRYSSSSSGPGLLRIASGTPILPTSCSLAAVRSVGS
jgi:hypothetical protein